MLLCELLNGIECHILNEVQVDITELSIDSRKCVYGSLFFCIEGINVDAHNFALDAVQNGAVAMVVSKQIDIDIPQILVKDVRKTLTKICSNFYNNVDKKLKFIGITGTNGKTTTSFIIKAILEGAGKTVGVIGTSGCFIGDKRYNTYLTTPDTIDLYKLLEIMHKSNVEYVIMEVSAHSIALDKIFGLRFEIGIFTNLTQDHLDYFKTIQSYWQVKKHFLVDFCDKLIVNVDDYCGKELLNGSKNVYTYGLNNPSDIFAVDIRNQLVGSEFFVNLNDEVAKVKFVLPGEYNVYNVMAGLLVGHLLGVNLDDSTREVSLMCGVDGRCDIQKVKDFYVIIDYAHTPDALLKLLTTVKQLAKGRIITVFGASGNRDALKRPLMGKVVSLFSDYSIITSDNPAFEVPEDIIENVARGYINDKFEKEADRAKAVAKALVLARQDDIVVICGKGRETSQDVKGVNIPYCDYDEVQKFIDHN